MEIMELPPGTFHPIAGGDKGRVARNFACLGWGGTRRPADAVHNWRETHSIALTAEPVDYNPDFKNVGLSNQLNFSFPVTQKHEWDRPLGFALKTVSLAPVDGISQGPKAAPP